TATDNPGNAFAVRPACNRGRLQFGPGYLRGAASLPAILAAGTGAGRFFGWQLFRNPAGSAGVDSARRVLCFDPIEEAGRVSALPGRARGARAAAPRHAGNARGGYGIRDARS